MYYTKDTVGRVFTKYGLRVPDSNTLVKIVKEVNQMNTKPIDLSKLESSDVIRQYQLQEGMEEWYKIAHCFEKDEKKNPYGAEFSAEKLSKQRAKEIAKEYDTFKNQLKAKPAISDLDKTILEDMAENYNRARIFETPNDNCNVCLYTRYHHDTGQTSLVVQYIHPGNDETDIRYFGSGNSSAYSDNEVEIMNQFYLPLKEKLLNKELEGIDDVAFLSVESGAEIYHETIDRAVAFAKEKGITSTDEMKILALGGVFHNYTNPGFEIKPSLDIRQDAMLKIKMVNEQGFLVNRPMTKKEYQEFIFSHLHISEYEQARAKDKIQKFKNIPSNHLQVLQKELFKDLVTAVDLDGWVKNPSGKITSIIEYKTGPKLAEKVNVNMEAYELGARSNQQYVRKKNYTNQIYFQDLYAKNLGADYFMQYTTTTSQREIYKSKMLQKGFSENQIEQMLDQSDYQNLERPVTLLQEQKIYYGAYHNGLKGQFAFTTYGTYSQEDIIKFGDLKTLIDYDIRIHCKKGPCILPSAAPEINERGQALSFQLKEAIDQKYKGKDFLDNENLSKYPAEYRLKYEQSIPELLRNNMEYEIEQKKEKILTKDDYEYAPGEYKISIDFEGNNIKTYGAVYVPKENTVTLNSNIPIEQFNEMQSQSYLNHIQSSQSGNEKYYQINGQNMSDIHYVAQFKNEYKNILESNSQKISQLSNGGTTLLLSNEEFNQFFDENLSKIPNLFYLQNLKSEPIKQENNIDVQIDKMVQQNHIKENNKGFKL